jgi:WD40 repeat protein
MKSDRPKFKLARVSDDASQGSPEIVTVTPIQQDAAIGRRSFLGTGIGATAALLLAQSQTKASGSIFKASGPSATVAQEGVTALTFSLDGNSLVSVSDHHNISHWSLPKGELVATRKWDKQLPSQVLAITHSAQMGALAGPLEKEPIQLWSLEDGQVLSTLEGSSGTERVRTMAVTSDGSVLASADGKTIKLWSLEKRTLLSELSVDRNVEALAIAPDGQMLAAACDDHTITLWSLDDHQPLNTLYETPDKDLSETLVVPQRGQSINRAGLSNDPEKFLASLRERLRATLEGHPASSIQSLAIGHNGESLAAGYSNGEIKMWYLLMQRRRTKRARTRRRRRSSSSSGSSYPVYRPPVYRGPRTMRVPCTSAPIPAGMVCTCNCV